MVLLVVFWQFSLTIQILFYKILYIYFSENILWKSNIWAIQVTFVQGAAESYGRIDNVELRQCFISSN
jgi:hypothetical protein